MTATRVLRGAQALRRPPTCAVVTVGVFDGVHLAHQQVIRSTVRVAQRLHGTSLALTFDPDPHLVLDPAHAQPSLMPLEVRLSHMRAFGLDRIWVMPFTTRFARLTAAQFIERILVGRLHAAALVVGDAFVFGKGRQGDVEMVRTVGARYGIRVVPVRAVRRNGAPISSSRIRQLMVSGELSQAGHLLGRPPTLYGDVVRGAGRGRTLGIPTANLRLTSQTLPPRGVYAVHLQDLRRPRQWRGVMNLGVRPTFGSGPLVCEVHVLGFSGSLLGCSMAVSLIARLRAERRFPTPAALIRQVRRDAMRARVLLARAT